MRISDWSSDVCSSDLVGQIVPGIGEQRDRIGDEAIARLDRDEAEVERDADRERAIEARGGVAVAVRMIVAHRRIATIVSARDTRTWRARSADRPARALDRKSTRLNSSHLCATRMPSFA